MKAFSIPGLTLLFLLVSSGCQTAPRGTLTKPPPGPTATSEPLPNDLRTAKALLAAGNTTAAIAQFAYLRDHASSVEERDRAVIGLSMALQDAGNTGAALGVLQPLPDLPKTGLEAMKCVLAGELYLHQRKYQLAYTWLARGLDVEPEGQRPYRASALFNFGKTLLAQDNLEDALIAFEMAQDAFTSNGDVANAEQCQTIVADIRTSLL
jgi:tetratricopeptide (TPR) repeat protein